MNRNFYLLLMTIFFISCTLDKHKSILSSEKTSSNKPTTDTHSGKPGIDTHSGNSNNNESNNYYEIVSFSLKKNNQKSAINLLVELKEHGVNIEKPMFKLAFFDKDDSSNHPIIDLNWNKKIGIDNGKDGIKGYRFKNIGSIPKGSYKVVLGISENTTSNYNNWKQAKVWGKKNKFLDLVKECRSDINKCSLKLLKLIVIK